MKPKSEAIGRLRTEWLSADDLLWTYSARKKNSRTSPNLLLHAASLC